MLKTLARAVQRCTFFKDASSSFLSPESRAAVFVLITCKMGKPLSRPDCLRQNAPCVGKGEEEEDLNIEDCYVPQRSIYDTVRLNEQIDSGSKGSLSSRHFTDRTLPYSHRTLDVSSLCSNGALTSSSVFELRGREANKLDEKTIFDALKLNSDIIRTTGLPRAKSHAEKKEHRRSWRMFVPANFMDYANKSESSFVEPTDLSDAVIKAGKCRWGTNSLTSEDDDSGLCSPPAEREEKQGILAGDQPRIRSLSSAEDIPATEQHRTFFSANSLSEQKIPLLSCTGALSDENFKLILHDASPLEETEGVNGPRELPGDSCCPQDELQASTVPCEPLLMARYGEKECVTFLGEEGRTEEFQFRAQTREPARRSPYNFEFSLPDLGESDGDCDCSSRGIVENVTVLTPGDSKESSVASTETVVVSLSARELEVIPLRCSLKFTPGKKKAVARKAGAQAGTWETICNGFQSAQVIKRNVKPGFTKRVWFCFRVVTRVSHHDLIQLFGLCESHRVTCQILLSCPLYYSN